jgi:BASS family bile acid:Na+ symporter
MIRALHWLQRRMIWLLLSTYPLGALFPRVGLSLRAISVGTARMPGVGSVLVSLPMLMLGTLLVVAGLGTNLQELRHTLRRPGLLVWGLAANAAFPLLFGLAASLVLLAWHDPAEAQNILVGLAMIGAMPIAGASTAWSQNASGNLALSLGLVLLSTLLSPLLTPLGLHAMGALTRGDYSEDLHELASQGSSGFVILAVVLPSTIGISARALLGARRVQRVLPHLKLLNLVNLLVLNYSNAAAALPQVVHGPDWDFLALTLALAATMCAGAFALGWFSAPRFRADRADQTSLTYGLGMNNNGTGLVLASSALADHPLVLLPIIFYNLVQQIAAAVVDVILRRQTQEPIGYTKGVFALRP